MFGSDETQFQSREAEVAFLGAVILSGSGGEADNILSSTILTSADFYKTAHQKIFQAMIEISKDGRQIDFVTLSEELKKDNSMEQAGGHSYIASMINETPTTANWEHHERIIKEYSMKRKLIEALFSAYQDLKTCDADAIIERLKATHVSCNASSEGQFQSMLTVCQETVEGIEARSLTPGISGVPSGFTDLDEISQGWQPQELYIIAGRPSMGKTAFALALAQNAAQEGHGVAFLSLEMGSKQIGIRIIAAQTGVPLWQLRKSILSKEQWSCVCKSSAMLSELPIFFDFTAFSDRNISRSIDTLVRKHKVKLLILDYLQIVSGTDSKMNREREVAAISRMLKLKTMQHGIPIICLAQLNRGCELRHDRRPILADIRESGAAEQDADGVLFLYRDDYYNKKSKDKGIVEILIRKGRNMGIGTVKLYWDSSTTTFKNYTEGGYVNVR